MENKLESLTASRDEVTGRWSIEGLEPSAETFDKIVSMLKENVPFKFARYGDGEWLCIFGKNGANCDGHQYFPDMGTRLRQSIVAQPDYMVGIQPLSLTHKIKDKIIGLTNGLDIDWYDADSIHSASIDGRLNELLDALEGRYVILVGPAHLAMLFDCVHIVIPDKDCWNVYNEVSENLKFHLSGINNAVVLLCASMMSEVIIFDNKDEKHTFIDVGSALDPMAGVKSRSYHFKL